MYAHGEHSGPFSVRFEFILTDMWSSRTHRVYVYYHILDNGIEKTKHLMNSLEVKKVYSWICQNLGQSLDHLLVLLVVLVMDFAGEGEGFLQ